MERLAIDLLAPELYAGDPYPTYAWMRANEPVYWDEVNELWGISRYDDIVRIEKDKETFISSDTEKGGYRPNLPADPAIIGLDDPLHHKRRNLVSRRFTPRAASDVGGRHPGQGHPPARRASQAKGGDGRGRRASSPPRCPP